MGQIVDRSYIMGYSEKNSILGQMGHLGPRMTHLSTQHWICCKDCFTVLHNERSQERHRNYVNGFEQFGHFGPKMIWRTQNFGCALRFFY